MTRNALRAARLARQPAVQNPCKAILAEFKDQGVKIPNSLWQKARAIANDSSAEPDTLLIELFSAAKKPSQTVFIGNLLLEKQVRLPVKQESVFIMALAHEGKADQAVQLWRSRQVPPDQSDLWQNLGIQLNCAIGRLSTAESIALNTPKLTDKSIYALIEAYSVAGGPRLDFWVGKLAEQGSTSISNRTVRMLLRRRQRHAIVPLMAKIGDKLSQSTVLSVLAATKHRSAAAVALSTHPDIRSHQKFLKSWLRSTDEALLPDLAKVLPKSGATQTELIDSLLAQNRVDQALELLEPPYSIASLHLFIRHAVETSNEPLLQKSMSLVAQTPQTAGKYSRTVQMVLRYLTFQKRYKSLFGVLQSLDLPKLHHSNYIAIWKVLLMTSKIHRHAFEETRFDVQRFLVQMLSQTNLRMDPLVFELAAKTFVQINDISSAAVAIRYMVEVANLPITPEFTISILGDPKAAGVTTWEQLIERLCHQRGLSFDTTCSETKAILPQTF